MNTNKLVAKTAAAPRRASLRSPARRAVRRGLAPMRRRHVEHGKHRARGQARPLFDPAIVRRAIVDSFRKLDPRHQVRNPVMFVVEVGSVLTTALFVQAARRARARRRPGSSSPSRSGSGSPCSSRTSPRRWPRGAARRRPTRCARRARTSRPSSSPSRGATPRRAPSSRRSSARATSCSSRRATSSRATARSSRASPRSTRAPSPARARRSSARAAATAAPSPAARACSPTGSSSASRPTPARRSSTA